MIINYLGEISETLTRILEGRKEYFASVDCATIKLLQLRAPGISIQDRNALNEPFKTGVLFPSIRDPSERLKIWTNLQNIKMLIPTLFTLFEDIKYLKEPATVMKQLFNISSKSKRTIKEEMYYNFSENGEDEYSIEQSGNSCRGVKCHPNDHFEFAYREVWLCAWRDWAKLIPAVPKKELGEKMPIPHVPDAKKWYKLAAGAKRRGFGSCEIERILAQDPDRRRAKDFLLEDYSSEDVEYDDHVIDEFVKYTLAAKKSAHHRSQQLSIPALLVHGTGESHERRCGRTFEKAYNADRKHFFLHDIYNSRQGDGDGVSSFLVRSSVFFHFFGRYGIYLLLTNARLEQSMFAELNGVIGEIPDTRDGNNYYARGIPENLDFGPVVEPRLVVVPAAGREEEMPLAPIATSKETLDESLLDADDTSIQTPHINLKFWENGKPLDEIVTIKHENLRSALEQTLKKRYREYYIYDLNWRALSVTRAFDEAVKNKTYTLYLKARIGISRSLMGNSMQFSRINPIALAMDRPTGRVNQQHLLPAIQEPTTFPHTTFPPDYLEVSDSGKRKVRLLASGDERPRIAEWRGKVRVLASSDEKPRVTEWRNDINMTRITAIDRYQIEQQVSAGDQKGKSSSSTEL